jgi:hypothetical protein
MNFWIALGLATVFLIAAIAVFATKFLFPYHRVVALLLYAVGWVPFLYSIALKRQLFLQHQEAVTSFLGAFWVHIVFGVVLVVTLYALLVLFPVTRSPFTGMSDEEISLRLKEDRSIILFLDEKLVNLLTEADNKNLFATDFSVISSEQKESLRLFWTSYLETLLELDVLKERYTTFYQLNAVTRHDLHRAAFLNGYTAFLSQHYYALQLTNRVHANPDLVTYFDEPIDGYGIDAGMYTRIREKITNPDELLRLNAGRMYSSVINAADSELGDLIYRNLTAVDASLGDYAQLIADKPLSFLERNSFKLWFPIQKQSAVQISYVRLTDREYHITPEQIHEYRSRLLPGDIFLQRREWHATNVGIPGYWTHNALYLGTLEYLDNYFKDIPELAGSTFGAYLKNRLPAAYAEFIKQDEAGYQHAVIESKRPGVILTSLELSNNADSLGVLRVKGVSIEQQFKIVMQALSHFGKPYDFDFNFVTDTALVCSELVFKAYQDIPKLSIDLEEMNGRLILSPNAFAEKYSAERGRANAELELILFLDGDEKTGIATERGSEAFAQTWTRPKWHIASDFVSFE